MMRRFSRKRRPGTEGRHRPIDAGQWFAKILEAGVVEAASLEPVEQSKVPDSVAAIGRGERADGSTLLVAFSPRSATEALLGGLAAAQQAAAESSFAGPMFVVAPHWSAGARRLLALLGRTPFTIEAVAAPGLSDARGGVEVEPQPAILATGYQQLAARMASVESRVAFIRAATALEGLAAKHGGAVRVGSDRVELVVLARRVAEIRTDGESASIVVQLGVRSTTSLTGGDLAGALDGLEGQIRKRLNDRKLREGEEGLRGRVVAQLAAGDGLRGLRPWPQPGAELDVVDAVAVNADGDPVIVAVRAEFDWTALAAVVESMAPLAPLLPVLFADVGPPLRLGAPRFLFVAEHFAEGLEGALSSLTIAYELRNVAPAAGSEVDLVAHSSGEGAEARPARRGRRRGGRSGRAAAPESRAEATDAVEEIQSPEEAAPEEAAPEEAGGGPPKGPRADDRTENDEGAPSRSRRRRRPRRGRGVSPDAAAAESGEQKGREGAEGGSGEGPRQRTKRFEEVSLMDLDDAPGAGEPTPASDETAGGKSRRPRRRPRRAPAADEDRKQGVVAVDQAEQVVAETARPVEEEDLVDSDDLEEILARLADDGADLEPPESTEPTYDDEEEVDEDGASDSVRRNRETRRDASKAGGGEDGEESRPAPRRRSAIVVHADRDSLIAALLLARDIRQLEGIWVYPQQELMTFFRGVATDLREETPIFVVGFNPSPARDLLQASSLYRGRLTWFDRQAWPPEDLMAFRGSLGADAIHGGAELDSSLPLVLETCTRRSRFSDKLVDLATGRFTQHDFERWGRVWWWRIGEIAEKTGDIRADIAPILTGRPSDLAKEAALVDLPSAPAEVAYVAEHDFRLVHFGGHVMVVVPVEAPLDLHLAARIARERYETTLSLAYREGGESLVLAGDEVSGKRALDYQGVVAHLVDKLEWVEARPNADHVARCRIRELAAHPERMEELIGEIAMGRTLLER